MYDLIEAELPRLRRYARLLVEDAGRADDMVLQCLHAAVDRIDLFEPGTNLRAWMFKILRDQIAAHGQTILDRQQGRPVLNPSHDGQDAIAGFYRLERDYQEVLLLVALEGLRYEETADILNVPLETVRSRLSQARASLRNGEQNLSEDGSGY